MLLVDELDVKIKDFSISLSRLVNIIVSIGQSLENGDPESYSQGALKGFGTILLAVSDDLHTIDKALHPEPAGE